MELKIRRELRPEQLAIWRQLRLQLKDFAGAQRPLNQRPANQGCVQTGVTTAPHWLPVETSLSPNIPVLSYSGAVESFIGAFCVFLHRLSYYLTPCVHFAHDRPLF